MGRRADDYHVMMDGRPCPSGRVFQWQADGRAFCRSCGKDYVDHVKSEEPDKPKYCIICGEDHE